MVKPSAERLRVKRNDLLLVAMLAAGTATFLFAVIKRWKAVAVTPYTRPKGGERIGDFEVFIG
jgi:hypothetical protein